jgi:hypothetical protein
MLEINNMYDPAAPRRTPQLPYHASMIMRTQNSCAAMAAATSHHDHCASPRKVRKKLPRERHVIVRGTWAQFVWTQSERPAHRAIKAIPKNELRKN